MSLLTRFEHADLGLFSPLQPSPNLHKVSHLSPHSAAAAALDNHVVVVLERDFAELVDVEHGDGREVRGAALGGQLDTVRHSTVRHCDNLNFDQL